MRLVNAVLAGAVCATVAGSARAADSGALVGVHFWGDRNDGTPAAMLDSVARGAWDLEIVNTANLQFGGWKDEDVVDPLYQNFKNAYHVTPITRLGYYWGKTLPAPGTPEYAGWANYIQTDVAGRMKDTAHIWQMGNEPNLNGEATNWVNQQITPAAYATLYRSVRTAIGAPSVQGAAGPHKLLVAPVSPGGVGGDRWISGTDWLDQTLAGIPAAEVDGVALHAYGGGGNARSALQDFRNSLLPQIDTIDARGLGSVPLYITEWNRATPIGDAGAQEAITADFVRSTLKFLNRWNRTPGNHNVVSTQWFVYDTPANDGGGWDTYSIEYWKTHGGAGSGDLYQTFFDAARAGYKAGVSGTNPIPAGVQIIDDFESGTDHFSAATPAPGGSGTTTGTSARSFKVRQRDADSYTKDYAHKIGIVDDPANSGGWTARYLSGGGSPSGNTPINLTAGADGYIGFFLRVYTANGSEDLSTAGLLETQLVLDSGTVGGGVNSDAGRRRTIVADGEWHYYQWNVDDAADWVAWAPAAGSDGKLGTAADFTGQVTIDSIMFYGGNVNVEYLLDTIMVNRNGTLAAMDFVPEPGLIAPAGLGAVTLLRRQRRERR